MQMDFRRILHQGLQAVDDALWLVFLHSPLTLWFDKPSAPAPPDYTGAANATSQGSVQAAIAQSILANKTQNTPYGSLEYQQTGVQHIPGVDTVDQYGRHTQGPGYDIPTWESNVNLSPEVQGLVSSDLRSKAGLAGLTADATGRVGNALSQSFSLDGAPDKYNKDVADAMYRHSTAYLDPQWQSQTTDMENKLANAGFSRGAAGWTNAEEGLNRQREFAYGQARDAATAGGVAAGTQQRQQAIQEMLLQRQLPLQELNALRTGSAPTLPSFSQGTAQGIQGADYAGAATQAGQAANARYNADVGTANANTAAGVGLAGAALLAFSDRRLKKNVRRIGRHPLGIGVYEFEYVWGGGKKVGVMSDEVKRVKPSAVMLDPSGYD